MKKLIITLLIGGFLVSCGSDNPSDEEVKSQIREYRMQITELEKKIKDLEGRLTAGNPSGNSIGATRVRTMQISPRPFSRFFTATGEIEAIDEAFISPEVSGQITSIHVKEGQKVKRGQLLAKLNTSLIEKNIEEVKTQLELAETLFRKQSELWDKGIGSERQYLESKNNYENLKNSLATLQEQYNMSIIHSPINGYVENIMLKTGELASPGMQLMQIVDLDNLQVVAMLSEAYIPVIEKGEIVALSFPSFPDLSMEEEITRIGNVVNKQNRTFRVEVNIGNPGGRLKPNLLANITINDYNSKASLVVPSMVIREDLVGSYLYVAEQEGDTYISKKKYVELGRAYQGETEVVSGLSVGDRIITDGYGNVSDGMNIEIVG